MRALLIAAMLMAGIAASFAGGPAAPVVPSGTLVLSVKTVGTLPTCNTAAKGTMLAVSDASSPAYNVAVVGSGTSGIPVYCNGTSWIAH